MVTFIDSNGNLRHDTEMQGGNFEEGYLSLSIEKPYTIEEMDKDIDAEAFRCGAVLFGMSPGSKMKISLLKKKCILHFKGSKKVDIIDVSAEQAD